MHYPYKVDGFLLYFCKFGEYKSSAIFQCDSGWNIRLFVEPHQDPGFFRSYFQIYIYKWELSNIHSAVHSLRNEL